MPTASTLEIVSTAGKLVTTISDVPALSALKPIGGILVTICDHVEALESNKEAAIMLAERVNRAVEVLTNRAQNLDGVEPGNYSDDIKSLEDVLVKIATALEKSRRRKWFHRVLSPKADAAELSCLSSNLDFAIRMFGLAADFEARLTFQTLRAHFPKGGSELCGTAIRTSALRVHSEMDATDDYSVQVGTYDNQAVIVKKYYTGQEERFKQDLRQRRNLIHPGIACIVGSADEASIMLLCAEGLILCPQNTIDISRVRDPWKHRRIGPQIALSDMRSRPPSMNRQSLYPAKKMRATQAETLTIKESDALLQQFMSVIRFLGNMKVEVAWWEFKPSWVGLRGENQLILIDWDQDSKSTMGGEFEPRYAIHVIGLGFSDIVPETFRDSGRLLEEDMTRSGERNPLFQKQFMPPLGRRYL